MSSQKGPSGGVRGVKDLQPSGPQETSGIKKTSPKKTSPKKTRFPGIGRTVSDTETSGTDTVQPKRTRPFKDQEPASTSTQQTRGRPKTNITMTGTQVEVPPRRRSPRKKIIADSPPPEDRIDPFPPERPPMTVSDKPAVRNRYGEKVTAPVSAEQRLQQAANFLSDEGPENCADFEDKLNRLESWFRKNYPSGESSRKNGQSDEIKHLARKVDWMIWVHRNRLEEGAEQWFVRNQFPHSKSMKKSLIPEGADRWQALNAGVQYGAPKYPKLQVMLAEEKAELLEQEKAKRGKPIQPSKAGTSAVPGQPPRPPTKPPVQERVGPWDEPMPRPEVWHRKEAARFPFGETPYMEQVMSRQIHEDLRRGREAKERAQGGWLRPLFRAMSDWFGDKPEEYAVQEYNPWKLPEVSEEAVWQAMEDFGLIGEEAQQPKKRKATADANKAAGKRRAR